MVMDKDGYRYSSFDLNPDDRVCVFELDEEGGDLLTDFIENLDRLLVISDKVKAVEKAHISNMSNYNKMLINIFTCFILYFKL